MLGFLSNFCPKNENRPLGFTFIKANYEFIAFLTYTWPKPGSIFQVSILTQGTWPLGKVMRYNLRLRATAMAPQVVMAKNFLIWRKCGLGREEWKNPTNITFLEIDRNTRFILIFKTLDLFMFHLLKFLISKIVKFLSHFSIDILEVYGCLWFSSGNILLIFPQYEPFLHSNSTKNVY